MDRLALPTAKGVKKKCEVRISHQLSLWETLTHMVSIERRYKEKTLVK